MRETIIVQMNEWLFLPQRGCIGVETEWTGKARCCDRRKPPDGAAEKAFVAGEARAFHGTKMRSAIGYFPINRRDKHPTSQANRTRNISTFR